MKPGWFIGIWLTVLGFYHAFVWPAYWMPARGLKTFLVDAVVSFFFTSYLAIHYQRATTYRSVKHQWGQVIREHELTLIKKVVGRFKNQETACACRACIGAGKTVQHCEDCGGRGFLFRPFEVQFKRDHLFIGFDAVTGEEVRLEGEAVFRSTLVFGATGSGKTKRAAHLINRQLFRDPLGTAIFFSLKKGDAEEVASMAREEGWDVHSIRSVNLLTLFETWSDLSFGLKMGLRAAGYRSRESFWADRAIMLLKTKASEMYKTDGNARMGTIISEIMEELTQEARQGGNVKIDLIAISDFGAYFQDFMDPLTSCRWLFDAGPEDYVPDGQGGIEKGKPVDWSILSKPKQLLIIPPIGASRTGVVAATALKFALYLWFDKNKTLQPDPTRRRRFNLIQDEGDNFLLTSDKGGIDDGYAAKTWREFGYASWCYTQSPEFLKLAMGSEKCRAYIGVIGNTLSFALPDVEVEQFVKGLPTYDYVQRSINLNRRSNHYQDHESLLTGNLLVTRGETLSHSRGPWITGEFFQKLPSGCCVLQQAGKVPRVVWAPYYDHVDFT